MTLQHFISTYLPDLPRTTVAWRIFRLDSNGKLPDGCAWEQMRYQNGWEISKEQAEAIAPLILNYEKKPYDQREGIGKRGKGK